MWRVEAIACPRLRGFVTCEVWRMDGEIRSVFEDAAEPEGG